LGFWGGGTCVGQRQQQQQVCQSVGAVRPQRDCAL
jgi:hypothetical protein